MSTYPQGPDFPQVEDDYFFSTTSAEGAAVLTGDSYFTARHMMVWNDYTATWDETDKPPLEEDDV